MAHSLALGASNLANPPTNAPTPHATAIDAITDAHVHGRRVTVSIAVTRARAHRDIAFGRTARRRLARTHKVTILVHTHVSDPNVRTNGYPPRSTDPNVRSIINGRVVVVVVISTRARRNRRRATARGRAGVSRGETRSDRYDDRERGS
jgi:hypothetical protein